MRRIRLLKVALTIGALLGLTAYSDRLSHEGGVDAGRIFFFFTTVICGVGWVFTYSRLIDLKNRLCAYERVD
jgi:hypothetical protein